jgi:hypothetical protein
MRNATVMHVTCHYHTTHPEVRDDEAAFPSNSKQEVQCKQHKVEYRNQYAKQEERARHKQANANVHVQKEEPPIQIHVLALSWLRPSENKE